VFAPANRDNKANHNPVSTRKANLREAMLCAAEELRLEAVECSTVAALQAPAHGQAALMRRRSAAHSKA